MICLRCCFKFIPVRVPFSKSTVFEICRQKLCRFRVNRRPIRHIFHRFQNLPASCERSLNLPLDCSETFNIFRITVFFFLFKNSRKFSTKNLKTILISIPVDERSNNFTENHNLRVPTIWYQAKLFHSSDL